MTPGCSPCRSEPASGKSDLLFENLRLGKNAPAATRAGLLRSQTLESIGENESSLRIADFHTYFVGCDEWGFSVWAHNLCAEEVVAALKKAGIELEGGVNHPVVKDLIAAYKEGGLGSERARELLQGLEGVSKNQAKQGVQALNNAEAAASAPATAPATATPAATGATGGSPTSVLQYGGNTISDATAAHFGAVKRDFGRALAGPTRIKSPEIPAFRDG